MAESKDALTETGTQPTSTQIRSEIERTRAEMDSTFDALERKMTPGQILEEAWHLTRGGTTAGASKLWQVAREHPLPATVIGLGLGWLLVESTRGDGRSAQSSLGRGTSYRRQNLYEGGAGYGAYPDSYNTDYVESWEGSQSSGLSDRVSSAAGSVKDAASHAAGSVKGAASHAADTVKGAASSAGHKVADVASSVRGRASDLGHLTRDKASDLKYRTRTQARRAQTGFWEMMEENPLAVGLSTLVLGVLAGMALPSTRREDELLGETRDRVVDRIEEVGREALDKGKQVAGTAVDTLKEEAQNAGLTPDALAEKVREAGRHAKDVVKEEVKSQGLTGSGSQGATSGSQSASQGSTSGSQGATSGSQSASQGSTSGSQGATSGAGAGLTSGGVTTPSATTGSTTGATTGGTSGTSGTSGSRGRTTPRETITPVNQPETANKR